MIYRNHSHIQRIKDKADSHLNPFNFTVGCEEGGQKTSYPRNMPLKFWSNMQSKSRRIWFSFRLLYADEIYQERSPKAATKLMYILKIYQGLKMPSHARFTQNPFSCPTKGPLYPPSHDKYTKEMTTYWGWLWRTLLLIKHSLLPCRYLTALLTYLIWNIIVFF